MTSDWVISEIQTIRSALLRPRQKPPKVHPPDHSRAAFPDGHPLDDLRLQVEHVMHGHDNGDLRVAWDQMGLFLVGDVEQVGFG